MQYALLIYTEEATQELSADEQMAQTEAYNAFGKHITDRGAMRAGEALHPIAAATTVRVRDGRTISTDGPFAETKEVLGGFYIVEAADLDEAIGYAAMIPGAKYGSIEVRPVWDFSGAATQAPPEAVGVD